jgi:hypothetical protein
LGTDVVEFLQLAALAEAVFDVSPNHAGSVFRSQRQHLSLLTLSPRLVFPGVHLFGDNVGFLAHSAGEKCRVLEDGGADFAEVVASKHLPRGLLDVVPERRFRG